MILIINICNEKFHYFEFVKPIEDVLNKNNIIFKTLHYKNFNRELISKFDKIIICGTSLKDNKFLDDIEQFNWIKECEKPILGICGGMYILGLVFDGKLKSFLEIGLIEVAFKNKFLKFKGIKQEYELHNFYVESDNFKIFGESKNCPQLIKHKQKPFYGVLFHPEVRNKNLLVNFTKI